jgi:hypothetical protein
MSANSMDPDAKGSRRDRATGELEMEELTTQGEKSEKIGELDQDESEEEFDEHSDAVEFSPGEEQRLVRKLDRKVVGLVAFLYLLSFLDRSSKCILKQ